MNANFSHLNQPLVLKNALIKNRLFFPNAAAQDPTGDRNAFRRTRSSAFTAASQRMAQR